MNDERVFILAKDKISKSYKLNVFDFETFDLVKVVDVKDEGIFMKLVSTSLDGDSYILYLYDQQSLEKKNEIHLKDFNDYTMGILSDRSKYITFYDADKVKRVCVD